MKTIEVKTGFGYYTDPGGKVIAKAQLPKGMHPLADNLNYIEVADEADLAKIQFNVNPAEQQKNQAEILIKQKTRELAVAALKAEGKLGSDYV